MLNEISNEEVESLVSETDMLEDLEKNHFHVQVPEF